LLAAVKLLELYRARTARYRTKSDQCNWCPVRIALRSARILLGFLSMRDDVTGLEENLLQDLTPFRLLSQ
jgi:hypothetical protein